MAIPETQLVTWSHQGSTSQSASTYETIKNALEDPAAPFSVKNFDIFLQGSYGNHTNIYADSDVDLAICLTSTYYSRTNDLPAPEKSLYEANRVPATYGFDEFKAEVLKWLRYKFGVNVHAGKKAIRVPGNGSRRDADVLVCAEHRDYRSYRASSLDKYDEGIVFWTREGREIVNYPKQHRDNCTSKHQRTGRRFKPNVRVVKNMRNAMLTRGLIEKGEAPSYFLEGMLSNVPDSEFSHNFGQSFLNAIVWLNNCNPRELTCVNDLHYLIRDNADVCWNLADFNKTRSALWRLWDQWTTHGRRAI